MYNAIQCEVRQQNQAPGHVRLGVADKVHRRREDFGREYARLGEHGAAYERNIT